MKIGIIGTGYVGLTQTLCMASYLHQHEFIGYDVDKDKIAKLNSGIPTIFEEGLSDLLNTCLSSSKNVKFTNTIEDLGECEIIFIAVGTPMNELGEQNLEYLQSAVQSILPVVCNNEKVCLVIKSTVLPGTCEHIYSGLSDSLKGKVVIANNPEYLREGFAINDFLHPDKVTIGIKTRSNYENFNKLVDYFTEVLVKLYTPIANGKIHVTSLAVSQAAKYVNNDLLATKIAKINEYRQVFNYMTDSEFDELMKSLGLDSRISDKFLVSGPGFGGSCFDKDTSALCTMALYRGFNESRLPLLHNTLKSNIARAKYCIHNINDMIKMHKPKKILFLGSAFKAGTDDVRYSKAIEIIKGVFDTCNDNAENITILDPKAINNTEYDLRNYNLTKVSFVSTDNVEKIETEILSSNFVVVLTEWSVFKEAFSKIPENTDRIYVDARHIVPESIGNLVQL